MPPAVKAVVEEMNKCRELYGEAYPFDPGVGGFDSVLDDKDKRSAVCRMMNAVLNGDWTTALEAAYSNTD
jgi:hypothetical protein